SSVIAPETAPQGESEMFHKVVTKLPQDCCKGVNENGNGAGCDPPGSGTGCSFTGVKEELRALSRIASREETLDPTKILTARVNYDKVRKIELYILYLLPFR
ncbi:hypothetical protein, partial [Hydrogenibacillus schlegelii]|uniref:hypothetical protein n=1 Tax=Hydrogenibacillus schlegelii TaxID=1484 RepID=UPI002357E6E2